jgi:acyl carrier protein
VADIGAEFRDILVFYLGVDESMLTENASFYADLAADSLDLFEVVVACEEKFDIDIPNDALAYFETVGDFLTYIEAKVHAANRQGLDAGIGTPRNTATA